MGWACVADSARPEQPVLERLSGAEPERKSECSNAADARLPLQSLFDN